MQLLKRWCLVYQQPCIKTSGKHRECHRPCQGLNCVFLQSFCIEVLSLALQSEIATRKGQSWKKYLSLNTLMQVDSNMTGVHLRKDVDVDTQR